MAMDMHISIRMLPQPDEDTCGPSSLHAVYNYWGDNIGQDQVIDEVLSLESGGTLAVFLACHALKRGYSARIYTYNLHVFDPTWFVPDGPDISHKLNEQLKVKSDPKLHVATKGYLEFLRLGGELRFEDLTKSIIRKYLKRGVPILTGLSSTYLYRSAREYGAKNDYNDIKGEPAGHFVILCGYDNEQRAVMVADPLLSNPFSESHNYTLGIDRVVCAILLGVITYDANLLIIAPKKRL